MKIVNAGIVLLALAVAGCATTQTVTVGHRKIMVGDLEGFNAAGGGPDRFNVHVYVDEDNNIVLDQEPLRRNKHDNGDVTLRWTLQADTATTSYSFPDDQAIVLIDNTAGGYPLPPDIMCGRAGAKNKVFICVYTRTQEALWKYTVRVYDNNLKQELQKLDPWVHQE